MAEQVIYPLLSGVNVPSNLLHVWMALHQLGVPAENLRLLPEIGHFAAPEVVPEKLVSDPDRHSPDASLRHPQSPEYDSRSGQLTVQTVDPEAIRPRFTISVRSDTLLRFLFDAEGNEIAAREETVGRLAHFMLPLLADIPGTVSGENARARNTESPVARLTRQLCERYPELLESLPRELRSVVGRVARQLERALGARDVQTQAALLAQVAAAIPPDADRSACESAFLALLARALWDPGDVWPRETFEVARAELRAWTALLFRETGNRQTEALRFRFGTLSDVTRPATLFALNKMFAALSVENEQERTRVVRELVEIITTEAFSSVAVLDALWGMGWVHGRLSDFDAVPDTFSHNALLLSVTGGLNSRTLLMTLVAQWAESGAFLGIANAGRGEPPPVASWEDDKVAEEDGETRRLDEPVGFGETLDAGILTPAEAQELWALAAWRRESPDPIALLEVAAQRLVHPDVTIHRRIFREIAGGFNTLFAQLNATATLGGAVSLAAPGVAIYIPLAEDANTVSRAAKAKLAIVLRVFLPIVCPVEIVWQEATARLGRSTYLKHDFQAGLRLNRDDIARYDPAPTAPDIQDESEDGAKRPAPNAPQSDDGEPGDANAHESRPGSGLESNIGSGITGV